MTRPRQDGGALLPAVLALLVASLTAIALLSMLLTDSRASVRNSDVARRWRAVDGALDVGIQRIRTSPGAVLGNAASCPATGGDLGQVQVEGQTVLVRCVALPFDAPPVAGGGEEAAVRLLGNYNGALDDWANSELSGVLGGVVSGVTGWLNQFLANGPGLVHAGPEPLRVVGGVRVRQSTLAYRYSPAGGPTVAGPSPSIDVVGPFSQGDCGLLGCIDVSLFGMPILRTPPCGVLDPAFSTTDFGLATRASPLQCNLGRGAAALADPNDPPPADWSPAQIRTRLQAVPACGPAGTVVALTPGSYGRAQTAVLNGWLRQGVCDWVTFWFQPGDYYFDVSGVSGDDRNALVFDDPTSTVVFGAPSGWDPTVGVAPASAFPMACDTARPGVSITLSSRTAVKHRNGRLAVCGTPTPPAGTPRTLLHQAASAEAVAWGAVPSAVETATNNPGWSSVDAARRSSPPIPVTYPSNAGPWDTTEAAPVGATVTCFASCAPTLRLTGFSDPGAPAPAGELTSARLRIRGDTSDVWFPTTRVNVVYGDGSGQCTVDVPLTMADNWNVVDVDLVAGCRTSAGLVDAGQLENATINLSYNMNPGPCFLWSCPPPPRASVDYVWLETNTSYRPPGSTELAVDPASGREPMFAGRVYMPRSQIEVRWFGQANRVPLFTGGLTARALASAPSNAQATNFSTGLLAAAGMAPGARRVLVRAEIGSQLVGSAEIVVTDSDPGGAVLDPGRRLEVRTWQRCARPATTARC